MEIDFEKFAILWKQVFAVKQNKLENGIIEEIIKRVGPDRADHWKFAKSIA